MKAVILAGGFGTRLSEYTDAIPKPMVRIGGYPILFHIMNHYSSYGITEFIIACGYKSEIIKEYFLNFSTLNSDFSVNLESGNVEIFTKPKLNWNITLVDTGDNSMTGGRLKRLEPYLNESNFCLTYGDGLSDVNIKESIAFHEKHNKLVTVTAVNPGSRFGELDISPSGSVNSFQEKPLDSTGRINGGFFVLKKEFIKLIDDDATVLEQTPMINAANKGEMMAFKHDGFWQCMDTKRDVDYLNDIWSSKEHKWNFIS